MSRSKILQRIRHQLTGEAVPSLPDDLPCFPVFPDPVARFQMELERVGGIVLKADTEEEGRTTLGHILELTGASDLFWESLSIFEGHGIPFRLRDPQAFEGGHLVFSSHFRGRVEFPLVLHCKPYSRDALAEVKLSVSTAPWAIAETGTIAHEVQPGTGRVLSVISPAHVAFLSRRNLLHNSQEFFRKRSALRTSSSSYTLVTGPSQTADIEKTLVRGVHGPMQWFVVLTP